MSVAVRIGLAVYMAGFALFAGLVILIMLNAFEVTEIEMSALPFVLALALVLAGKLMLARASKESGTTTNG